MSLHASYRFALVCLPVALALAGAPGCYAEGPEVDVATPSSTPMSNPPPSGSTGCSGTQWIGLKTTAACPAAAPNWTAQPLFSAPQPAALQHHCSYTWANSAAGPTAADIAALQTTLTLAGVTSLSEDCMIVGGLGDETLVNQEVRPKLHDALLSSAGAVAALPSSRSRSTIRVAVIDSAPQREDGSIPHGSSDHGYSMGWLAKSLSCPAGPFDPSCKTFVTTYLGLPLLKPDTWDTINGGFFGAAGHLAKAIHDATNAWMAQAQFGQSRLIINLSVGWQPGFADCPMYTGPSQPISGDVPKDSVFGALLEASCHGALIVAATGNHPGAGAFDPGPTCPAAWEAVRAPTQAECDAYFGDTHYNDGLPAGAAVFPSANQGPFPLVYGVGGVSWSGVPLSTSRPSSVSRLVAPAFGGAAGAPGEVPASPLTGSSVATALVSGAAAALWSYAPSLSAHALMAHVKNSGPVVEVPAGLRNPVFMNPPQHVHRLSLCAGLQAICNDVASCVAPSCGPAQPLVIDEETEGTINKFYGDAMVVNATLAQEGAPASDVYQDIAIPPWNHPLPVEPTCGGPCGYKPGAQKVEIAINPAYHGGTLTSPALVLFDAGGQRRVLKPANMISLQQGSKLILNGMTPPAGFTPVQAMLVFRGQTIYGDDVSVSEQILIR